MNKNKPKHGGAREGAGRPRYNSGAKEVRTFRLAPDVINAIDKLAKEMGINKTEVVEIAIRKIAPKKD